MKLNVYNVLYINLFEFLLQGLEFRLEISHLILLAEFFARAAKMFKQGINKQHHIFLADSAPNKDEESKIEENSLDYLCDKVASLRRESFKRQRIKENLNTLIKNSKHT